MRDGCRLFYKKIKLTLFDFINCLSQFNAGFN